ncbi:hypothetical protein B0H13DRAFT_1857566 [Mycena leptocephala]|nr:hypothetical protein B0H13DRAFT_1857566 [Mycena leptocephala]
MREERRGSPPADIPGAEGPLTISVGGRRKGCGVTGDDGSWKGGSSELDAVTQSRNGIFCRWITSTVFTKSLLNYTLFIPPYYCASASNGPGEENLPSKVTTPSFSSQARRQAKKIPEAKASAEPELGTLPRALNGGILIRVSGGVIRSRLNMWIM